MTFLLHVFSGDKEIVTKTYPTASKTTDAVEKAYEHYKVKNEVVTLRMTDEFGRLFFEIQTPEIIS